MKSKVDSFASNVLHRGGGRRVHSLVGFVSELGGDVPVMMVEEVNHVDDGGRGGRSRVLGLDLEEANLGGLKKGFELDEEGLAVGSKVHGEVSTGGSKAKGNLGAGGAVGITLEAACKARPVSYS